MYSKYKYSIFLMAELFKAISTHEKDGKKILDS